ncbi:MAG: hypothetical protein ABH807_01670 [Candidatus Shapirobacteria bacterium]
MFSFLAGIIIAAGAFEQSYQNYTFNYDQYRQSHRDYVITRQAYLSYLTLTAKSEAQNKTLLLLEERDETLKSYLAALKDKINESEGLSTQEKAGYTSQLENEIIWYEDHHNRLPSAGTLEDLVDSSNEVREHYRNTEILMYQVLTAVLSGKENFWRNRVIDQVLAIKSNLARIKQEGGKDIDKVERWVLEAENRITRSQEKQQKANEKMAEMNNSSNRNEIYNQSQFALTESHQYLKEANSYLRELIREIKTAD